jgi:hypothetical protein
MKIAWWNTKLRPHRSPEPSPTRVEEALSLVRALIDQGCRYIGLGEISDEALAAVAQGLRGDARGNWAFQAAPKRGLGVLYDRDSGEFVAARSLELARDRVAAGWSLKFEGRWPHADLCLVVLHWRTDGFEGGIFREECGRLIAEYQEPTVPTVVIGDFNCEPFDRAVVQGLRASRDDELVRSGAASFFNPFWSAQPSGPTGVAWGSLRLSRYSREHLATWRLVDFGVVNRALLANNQVRAEVVERGGMTSDHLHVIVTVGGGIGGRHDVR